MIGYWQLLLVDLLPFAKYHYSALFMLKTVYGFKGYLEGHVVGAVCLVVVLCSSTAKSVIFPYASSTQHSHVTCSLQKLETLV